jgi:hypothetical protein
MPAAAMPTTAAMPATAPAVPAAAAATPTVMLRKGGRSAGQKHPKAQSRKKDGTMFHFEPPAGRLITGV